MAGQYANVKSPDHGDIEFSAPAEIREFLVAQIPPFEWVRDIEPRVYNHLTNLINNSLGHVDAGQAQLQAQLDNTFYAYRFPINGSDISLYIDDVRSEDPSLAATILGVLTRSITPDLGQRTHMRAVGAILAYEQTLTPKSVEAARASFSRAVTSFQRQESAARGRVTAYENKIAEAEKRSARVVSIARRFVASRLRQQRGLDDRRVQASLDQMAATQALYMEHMALKAPVAYWKSKAASHNTKGTVLRGILLKYAIWGGLGLVAALTGLAVGSIFAINAGVPSGVLVVLATIGIVLTTIAFWAGRILTRLYLSEVHLSIDAGERATMVETYLALTSVAEASKEDRAIILASLFRPTADGIVKDDAAPELSPAGILSKALSPG